MATSTATESIGFLLLPRFSMLSLFCTLEPLRVANRFGGELFRWHFISTDGKDVVSSIGIPVSVEQSIDDVDHYPIVFVCASYEPEIAVDKRLLSWLKRVDRRGAVLGGLETGSYALARAGLLDGHKVAMHWESQPGFEESFPQLLTTAARYQIDARRMTCAGGISAMDMMLQFIGARHGNALATQVCETFMHDGVNQSHQLQRMQTAERFDIRHEQVWKIIELMEQNIEEPLSASQLADLNGLPLRQLERLFKKHCHDTPTRFYLRLRLERARQLLKHTRMSVVEVAVACGFHSPEYFSRRYRAVFDCSPREDRKIQAELERMSLGTCRTQR